MSAADRRRAREAREEVAAFARQRKGDEVLPDGYWRGYGARRRAELDDERARILPEDPPPGWPTGAP